MSHKAASGTWKISKYYKTVLLLNTFCISSPENSGNLATIILKVKM